MYMYKEREREGFKLIVYILSYIKYESITVSVLKTRDFSQLKTTI